MTFQPLVYTTRKSCKLTSKFDFSTFGVYHKEKLQTDVIKSPFLIFKIHIEYITKLITKFINCHYLSQAILSANFNFILYLNDENGSTAYTLSNSFQTVQRSSHWRWNRSGIFIVNFRPVTLLKRESNTGFLKWNFRNL